MSRPDELLVPPDPGALIESMRAFGYSLPTAIADLIDNSITAGATRIAIDFSWNGSESSIAVRDDGDGMDEETLLQAMRLGSRNPTENRAPDDLGRFGLGLKSAAWSQARSLTVVSSAGGPPLIRRWDLDHVTASRTWALLTNGTRHAEELATGLDGAGTIVLLEHPDRLVGEVTPEDEQARDRFLALVAKTSLHLSMVFHRFLSGTRAIDLSVNGQTVAPWDPFLVDHPATQRLPGEQLVLRGGRVLVAPFVLPHVTKLTRDVHATAAGPLGWNAQQGFYVYRARRLLVAGGWLGLRRMQQEEHYKLARIQVDLDNSMDEAWQIDVRKATARIPGNLQSAFDRIAKRTRKAASDAYRFRGKTVSRGERQQAIDFVWQRRRLRGGSHVFRINRNHPLLSSIDTEPEIIRAVEKALRLVEENLPVEAIVMESRERPDDKPNRPFEGHTTAVAEMLRQAHEAMTGEGLNADDALTALATVEPFEAYPELVQALREELDP